MPHLSRSSIMLGILCVFAIAMTAAPSAWGDNECKKDKNVIESAELAKNTAMCGHVKTHILGEALPPKQSRQGKTIFPNSRLFRDVWAKYVASNKEVSCSTDKNPGQEVAVVDLFKGKQDKIGGASCSAAGNSQCTNPKPTNGKFTKVAFYFAQVKPEDCPTAKKTSAFWILVTSYPTN
jgi:hypothetical protein